MCGGSSMRILIDEFNEPVNTKRSNIMNEWKRRIFNEVDGKNIEHKYYVVREAKLI